MCNKSESISKLAVALVKFNGEVSKISKDASNPFFKKNYASLDNIVEEIRPILNKHGLSIMQFSGGDGDNVIMKTMLLHESGEWIESDPLVMKPVKNDPQAVGSCVTYARRYSVSSFLSLNTGEDDDGNNATQKGNQSKPQSNNKPQEQHPTEPPASLKAKFQLGKGSLDGFEQWVSKMTDKGKSYRQMEHILQDAIKKSEESEPVAK